jgi:ferredoxin--NADP+ reductase
MFVKPDEPIEPFQPGQYTTLALGNWESRADDADEGFSEDQKRKMVRRSYSVSSSMVDLESGELLPPHQPEVEFYIVKVTPTPERIPGLTPRIFMKKEGDRIFMSRKFTGRYTLDGVQETDNVVFLSTGTGEAPQNRMTAELLRNGHKGQILNVVCVRYLDDLAYLDYQAVVEEKHDNYQYVLLTTREPDTVNNKVYIQDYLQSGALEEKLGAPLDPANTHVFLCGNPAMIGLPKWNKDEMTFPEVLGVCQILHDRGFKIDHLKDRGSVHYEEYWKEQA